MDIVLGVIFFFVAFLLLAMILLQEGKGGMGSVGGQAMDSVMGASNPLRRWTAYFFAAFVILTIAINYNLARQQASAETVAPGAQMETEEEPEAPAEEETEAAADAPTDVEAPSTSPAPPAGSDAPAPAAPPATP